MELRAQEQSDTNLKSAAIKWGERWRRHVCGCICVFILVYMCVHVFTDTLTSASLFENAMWWSEMQKNPWEIDKEVHKQVKLWVLWEGSKSGCSSIVKTCLHRLGSYVSRQFPEHYSPKAFLHLLQPMFQKMQRNMGLCYIMNTRSQHRYLSFSKHALSKLTYSTLIARNIPPQQSRVEDLVEKHNSTGKSTLIFTATDQIYIYT